ncbi:Histone deacetylase-like amidohydrolase [Novipirellula aureliae]|uniref:Histone deacetylase-like amidohydrolase n=1 Tax=Novipirellula aureliae TaxID=2527966 RepID=A0A5C6EB16_9BACT|nr:histone deacetylase [Novipirellula aureliae]TWU45715.1 Histone deacetylase-like amidohydrolase [Novipirellula aureliae]
MTLLYSDPVFQEHETGDHPECAARLMPVIRYLHFVSLDQLCKRPSWQPVTSERLERVHHVEYIESIRQLALAGGGQVDPDTIVSSRSYDVALQATGAVVDAVERVVRGEDTSAFCLSRPPGHHALADKGMGFCLFNHVAVAAKVATEILGLERVLIVDFDVHHGNGTQAIFWEDPRVGFFSIHRSPFYPHTGLKDEIGAGAGGGATRNVPIEFGTSRKEQLETFALSLGGFAKRMSPQLVLVSAGFDSHRLDPVGSLGLESEDFATITDEVIRIAQKYAEGRVVSVLEGGYNPLVLAECVGQHVEELVQKA